MKMSKKLDILPQTESHLAALGRCGNDDLAVDVWQSALDEVGGDISQVTAKLIKKHVDEAIGYESPDPDYFKRLISAWKKADEADRQRFLEQIEQEESV